MAMPLKDFIAETMQILKTSPDATEICVSACEIAALCRSQRRL